MNIIYDDYNDKPIAINTAKKDRSSNEKPKKLFEVLKAEAMDYLKNDCNRNNSVELFKKSNILFTPNYEDKEVIIKGLSLGKVCLSVIDFKEINKIFSKMGYKVKKE